MLTKEQAVLNITACAQIYFWSFGVFFQYSVKTVGRRRVLCPLACLGKPDLCCSIWHFLTPVSTKLLQKQTCRNVCEFPGVSSRSWNQLLLWEQKCPLQKNPKQNRHFIAVDAIMFHWLSTNCFTHFIQSHPTSIFLSPSPIFPLLFLPWHTLTHTVPKSHVAQAQ